MIPSDVVTALVDCARAADDAALALEAEAAAHRPEWDLTRAVDPPTSEAHARLVELFPRVVTAGREAARLRAEAALLRETARMIGETNHGT